MAGLIERGVLEPMHSKKSTKEILAQGNAMMSFTFLRRKFKADGSEDKWKARVTGNGKSLDRSQFGETSSKTASRTSLLFIAATAARESRHVRSGDVPQAFLQAQQQSEMYVILDKDTAQLFCEVDSSFRDYIRPDGTILTIARKALYGGIESSKLWYDEISSTLYDLGFESNPYDECVFNIFIKGTQLTAVIYVDDVFATCESNNYLDWFFDELQKKYGDMKVVKGNNIDYLGMSFDFSEQHYVTVSMPGFVKDLLEKFEVHGSARSPAADDLFVVGDSADLDSERQRIFHSATMTVLYLSVNMRWDLCLAVSYLSTRTSKPNEDDWKKLGRLLKYLNATRDRVLRIGGIDSNTIDVFVDASFATHHDRKSHSGCAILLGGGAIYAKSSRQKINSKSSTEAELIAISDSTEKVIWLRNFVRSQGYELHFALHQDNTSTIRLIERGTSSGGHSRYIDVKYFYIKDVVDQGLLSVQYTPTEDMIADGLTKPLQGAQLRESVRLLLNDDM